MKKIVFLLIIAILLPAVPIARSNYRLPVFLLEAKPGCYNTLLTFENFPESSSFEIWRGESQEKMAQKTTTFANWYLDQDNTNQGKNYFYQIMAKNDKNELIANSTIAQAKNTCPSDDSCSINLEYQVGSYMYSVDGKQEGPMDAAPEIAFGKMFLVIRYVTKEVEASVAWDSQTKRITITTWDNKTIVLWIGNPDAMVGNNFTRIDPMNPKVAPYIKNGRTYLPMRFVADTLGCNGIEWVASKSLAKLSMKKPKCFDLNSFNITFGELDAKTGLLNGTDDTGCQLKVILTPEQAETAKKLQKNTRIKVLPLEYNKISDVPEFKSKYLEAVDLKDAEEVRGKFVKSSDYSVTIQDMEGKEQSFRINMPLQNIRWLVQDDWISLYQRERNALDIRRILFEPLAKDEPTTEVKMRISKLNCRNGYILGRAIDRIMFKDQTALFVKKDSIACSAKLDRCYNFSCIKDRYGRLVVKTMTDAECPYIIEIDDISKQYSLFPQGGKCSLSFRLNNKEKTSVTVDTVFSPADFAITGLEMPKRIQIPGSGYKDIAVTFKLDPGKTGTCQFNYGYSDRGVENTKQGQFELFDPDFTVGKGEGNFFDSKDVTVKCVYRITNKTKTDLRIFTFANPEKEDFPGTIKFPIVQDRLIPAEASRDITFEIYWKKEAQPGTKHKIIYGATCGSKTISHELTLEVRRGGPYVRINEPYVDDTGKCTIFFDIDWKTYEREKIEVDWGDGKKETVLAAPVSHVYSRLGIYKIQVTAFAVSGETGFALVEAIFDKVKPSINIDEIKQEPDLDDKRFNFVTISGSVDWNGLKPGKITFDWGDGNSTEGDFPQKHRYTKGVKTLTITATAATGEEAVKSFKVNDN